MEIGLSTGVFYSKAVQEVLPFVARAGFESVELWTGDPVSRAPFDWRNPREVGQVQKLLKGLDLRAASFHAPYSEEADPSHPDPILQKRTLSLLAEAVEVAAALGARTLVLHGSAVELSHVSEAGRAARLKALRESLAHLHQVARSSGVAVAVETLLPHLFTADPYLLLDLVAPYPNAEVGICFDTGHCSFWRSWRLEQLYEILASRVIALHVNDNRGTYDDHLPPGQGKIDWPPWLTTLRQTGFSGVFLLEVVLAQDASDPVAALEALRQNTLGLLGKESTEARG
ncbi:MAG: sugar phosphate isomerase/epimerase [Methylacidiphilaceae bacterium]|nr:sugar phosphate isomerase/epimerase [Candidatus Methylacidiphilaceae bacterium]